MHIKRFEAPTMLEAVRKVKAELGSEALILSTRSLRRGGSLFGLFAQPCVEVTAAVDRDVRRRNAPSVPAVPADAGWKELRLTRALMDPLHEEVRALRRSVEQLRVPDAASDELLREIAALRRARAAGGAPWEQAGGEGAGRLVAPLLAAGLAPRHAHALAAQALLGEAEDAPHAARQALAERLDARLLPARDDARKPVDLFVGPTGVGKTTTLAKLAAREARSEGAVSLITTDTFRIGADAQLRTYADILGVPFEVAASPQDLCERLRSVRGRRALVDTAGRCRSDDRALAELVGCREALGNRARIHLVVSATTKEEDLREEVRRYEVLQPDSLVVTKVDESASLASVANVLLDAGTPPLAWLTHGQRVPEDLMLPDPAWLAQRVLEAQA